MIDKFFGKKILPVLLLIVLIPSISNLFKPGFFPMHDDMQAMRLLQMDKCIKDGQIPCRWVPDMGFGYGYPQFNYYAPTPYYVMEIIHLMGVGFLDSVKLGFALSLVVGAFGIYLFGSSLWGRVGGFLSAVVFAYAPYKAVDVYVRGAMGEVWGIAILPFVFWAARQVVSGKKKAPLWFAISLALLFTSHNILTFITAPILVLWIIFISTINKIYRLPDFFFRIKLIIFSLIWGGLISSFFVLPVFWERRFAHIETLLEGYFNYLAHFVSLRQLLTSSYWGYGSSELGPYDDISLSVGLLPWILPLLSLLLLIVLKGVPLSDANGKKKVISSVLFFAVVGWLALFMSHLKSNFIWGNLPILSYVQFPWRFLTIATFAFSAASGSLALTFPPKNKFISVAIILVVSFNLMLNLSFFRPARFIEVSDSEKFSGKNWQLQQTISIFDYLPIFAEAPPAERAPDTPVVVEGEVIVLDGQKRTNRQTWKLDVKSQEAVIRLPLFYFPEWKVWRDGELNEIDYDNKLGLITITLPSGEHFLEARLTDTPIRQLGNLASLVGILMIPIYLKKARS